MEEKKGERAELTGRDMDPSSRAKVWLLSTGESAIITA